MKPATETAIESVIGAHSLDSGYVAIPGDGFDRGRATFPETVLNFIRKTQPNEWAGLKAQIGEQASDQVLAELYERMDDQGALATLRHSFKCYSCTLHIGYFKAAHVQNPIRYCLLKRSSFLDGEKLRTFCQLAASLVVPLRRTVAVMSRDSWVNGMRSHHAAA